MTINETLKNLCENNLKFMKNIEFIWNKKCAIYIGRFQPFHEGHKKIVERAIKKYGQVAILVMNSFG